MSRVNKALTSRINFDNFFFSFFLPERLDLSRRLYLRKVLQNLQNSLSENGHRRALSENVSKRGITVLKRTLAKYLNIKAP